MDRIFRLTPNIEFTDADIQIIAKICRKLNGLPLAIELATGWSHMFSISEIERMLEDTLNSISSQGFSQSHQHPTIKNMLDKSCQLISPEEELLFKRLSVFSGKWILEAVGAVCSGMGIDEKEILNLISNLIKKSILVSKSMENGQTSYEMIGILQRYARNLFSENEERDIFFDRHLDYFVVLSENSPGSITDFDHDNIISALDWSLRQSSKTTLGLRLLIANANLWLTQYSNEGIYWLEQGFSRQNNSRNVPTDVIARALRLAGQLSGGRNNKAAYGYYQNSFEIYCRIPHPAIEEQVEVMLDMANFIHSEFGDFDTCGNLLSQAEDLILYKIPGNLKIIADLYLSQYHLSLDNADYDAARNFADQWLTIQYRTGNTANTIWGLVMFGELAFRQYSNYTLAQDYLKEAQNYFRSKPLLFEIYQQQAHCAKLLGENQTAMEYARKCFYLARENWYSTGNTRRIQQTLFLICLLEVLPDLSGDSIIFRNLSNAATAIGAIQVINLKSGSIRLWRNKNDEKMVLDSIASSLSSKEKFDAVSLGKRMKIEDMLNFLSSLLDV